MAWRTRKGGRDLGLGQLSVKTRSPSQASAPPHTCDLHFQPSTQGPKGVQVQLFKSPLCPVLPLSISSSFFLAFVLTLFLLAVVFTLVASSPRWTSSRYACLSCAENNLGLVANIGHSTQRLARFLDRPLFPWKKLIIGFSVAQYLFEGFLSLRQYQVLKKTAPPQVLKQEVSQEVYDKSQVCDTHSEDADRWQRWLMQARHTVARRRSSSSSTASTDRSRTLPSSTTTSSRNYGPGLVTCSSASRRPASRAKYLIRSSSSCLSS